MLQAFYIVTWSGRTRPLDSGPRQFLTGTTIINNSSYGRKYALKLRFVINTTSISFLRHNSWMLMSQNTILDHQS